MKSTRSLKSVRILLWAVLAAALSTSLASAQEYQGKSTLPFEAHLGYGGSAGWRLHIPRRP
jgi:hypothetical protein